MVNSFSVSVLLLAIALTLTGILAISWTNYLWFPRLQAKTPRDVAIVSVLVAARNEEVAIGATMRALLDQSYAGEWEVLVLDDCSSDGTAEAAIVAAAGDARFRLLQGAPVPEGWAGKPWACHQLALAARGELLVFTDADVRWEPPALSAIVAEREMTQAGLLTVWPTQVMCTWAERLVVPLMSFAVLAYLPVRIAHGRPEAAAAAANGQCMVFERAAYAACGGHAAVRGCVLEDVLLARRIKSAGLHLRMADGAGLIRTRMYDGWQQVRDGFAKNILAGHLDSVPLLLLSTVVHFAFFVLPWLWLATGFPVSRPVAALLVAAAVSARALTAATARQPKRDALLMPVSVLLMTRIAFQAIWWKWRYGGPVWKGRTLPSARKQTKAIPK